MTSETYHPGRQEALFDLPASDEGPRFAPSSLPSIGERNAVIEAANGGEEMRGDAQAELGGLAISQAEINARGREKVRRVLAERSAQRIKKRPETIHDIALERARSERRQ